MTDEREVEAKLRAQRPGPSPGFRGELSQRLAGEREEPGGIGTGALAGGCAFSGLLLLAVAFAGVAGAGPFAA